MAHRLLQDARDAGEPDEEMAERFAEVGCLISAV